MTTLQTFADQPQALDGNLSAAGAPQWYALHTRSRHEKKVHSQLAAKGYETFLPLLAQRHRWSDRDKTVHEPLFPGYVFVRTLIEPESRLQVLKTTGVVGVVGGGGQDIPIPDIQIENVRTLLAHDISFSPWPFLREGQRVRIRGGALDGIEGILLAKNSDLSVVVSVDLIHKSLAIRVQGYDLNIL